MELAREAWVWVKQPEVMRAGKLTLLPADGDGGIGWPNWNRAAEFLVVAWLRESQGADQLSYQPCSDPGL